jgi:acylphosphatase
MQQKQAISATVTGNDQRVGFRAMVMKQAIEYNLAGVAKNDANDIVHFTLQGDADRIGAAVAAVREGTKKSSNITVSTVPAAVDRNSQAGVSLISNSFAQNMCGRAIFRDVEWGNMSQGMDDSPPRGSRPDCRTAARD